MSNQDNFCDGTNVCNVCEHRVKSADCYGHTGTCTERCEQCKKMTRFIDIALEKNFKRDTFCSYCGQKYNTATYPKKCLKCNNTIWDNPGPVVVLLVEHKQQIYLVRRGINPGKGLLALPGGHMVTGETWQEAGARETWEELQIKVDPAKVGLIRVDSSSNFKNVLIFGFVRVSDEDVLPFIKNEEAEERLLVNTTTSLAFPTHTRILETFFLAGYRNRP